VQLDSLSRILAVNTESQKHVPPKHNLNDRNNSLFFLLLQPLRVQSAPLCHARISHCADDCAIVAYIFLRARIACYALSEVSLSDRVLRRVALL